MNLEAFCTAAALPPLALREETDGDLRALEDAYVASREEEFAAIPWVPEARSTLLRNQFRISRQQHAQHFPDMQRLVFCEACNIVGWACIARQPAGLRLVDLALVPHWRGRGVGTRFLASLVSLAAKDEGSIGLSVFQGNPAVALYLRAGFVCQPAEGAYLEMHHQSRGTGRPRYSSILG